MSETIEREIVAHIRNIWNNTRYHLETKQKCLQYAKEEIDKLLISNHKDTRNSAEIICCNSKYPPVDILTDDFLFQAEKNNDFVVTEDSRKHIRNAIAVGFIFGLAYPKTDPTKSFNDRLDDTGRFIMATKTAND